MKRINQRLWFAFCLTQIWMLSSFFRGSHLRSQRGICRWILFPDQRLCHRLFQQGHCECLQASGSGSYRRRHTLKQHTDSPVVCVLMNLCRFNVFSICMFSSNPSMYAAFVKAGCFFYVLYKDIWCINLNVSCIFFLLFSNQLLYYVQA
jgi:hypothetical protein